VLKKLFLFVFQSILTAVVNTAMELEIQLQFEIYAAILLVPTLGFAVFAILKIVLLSKRRWPVQF
jgi:hypothetical protein